MENDKEYTEKDALQDAGKKSLDEDSCEEDCDDKDIAALIKSPNLPKRARRRILQPNLSNMPLLQILLSFVRSTERSVWRI